MTTCGGGNRLRLASVSPQDRLSEAIPIDSIQVDGFRARPHPSYELFSTESGSCKLELVRQACRSWSFKEGSLAQRMTPAEYERRVRQQQNARRDAIRRYNQE